MTDFFYFLMDHLKQSILLALLAAAVGIAILLPIALLRRKQQKPFSWGRAILVLALLGYGAAVFSVTLLDRFAGYGQYANYHLFRAWREAWNNFSQRNWLNVLLNVVLFVPLGLLLPLLHQKLQRWYVPLLTGFGFSLLIEVTQYGTGAGLFDVDDLFCNTLGAFLGGCLILAILAVRQKRFQRLGLYLVWPMAFTACIAGIFWVYHAQEYGNLSLAPSYRMPVRGVTWELSTTLSDQRQTADVYQAPSFTRETAEEFGEQFFADRGWALQDRSYYDNLTIFQSHSSPGGSLSVNYLDQSYTMYRYAYLEPCSSFTPEQVLEALEPFSLDLPQDVEISVDEHGKYLLSVSQLPTETGMYDGTVYCALDAQGQVWELNQFLIHYARHGSAEIRSQQEAFEQLQKGHFTGPEWYPGNEPDFYEITGVRLEYRIDTKGFYRPVYLFDALVDGHPVGGGLLVPAQV